MRTTMIGNETFEVINTKELQFATYEQSDYSDNYDAIYEVYDRPSSAKVGIWHGWWNWAYDNNAVIRISGHNCMQFSIIGTVYTQRGAYNIWITRDHNRAYPVNA